ncbi:N-acyl-D-amino-acid deacylase family protein [Yinghuangia sp. YIM S09857]|uniref:N-acyl-D-amino-acid deacylase family protein n=1 Tax=Yinghuangia sp. YIM S09857 TaxID=3436929 RepID=UPI003F53AE6E
MHDLVIRGGTVVDGTGAPPRTADVAISGGRIREVGERLSAGRREIDASGLLVTPGWVDVHTHYDGNLLWDPLLTPSSTHGVTTVVTGNCGVGLAPVRAADLDWTIALMEGVEDIPGDVMRGGLAWDWESFPEYLDAVARVPRAIDAATQVPHAAVRVFAMGERGIDHASAPTDDEIRRMGEIAAEAVVAGALGFSTSRSVNHHASDGRLTPTLTASAAELVGIAEAVGRTGLGVFEAVFEDPVDAHFEILRRMCEVSGRPMSVTTLQRPGEPSDGYRRILRHLDAANAAGLRMRGQVAPRPVGLLMSLAGRVHPLLGSATYRALAAEGGTDLTAALRTSDVRERILGELRASGTDPAARFAHSFELGTPPSWDADVRRSLTALAAERNTDQIEVAYDVVTGGGTIYTPVANFTDGDLSAVRDMLVHPLTVPGLGDGGAHCTMIADFDFPTFLMSYWARDVAEDQRLPVEWVVKQQCADTAALVGLTDRGTLLPGMKADVNLIDFDQLGTTSPRMARDLPSDGPRLLSAGVGYVATIVAGQLAFEDGEHTGALAGALVRGGDGRD